MEPEGRRVSSPLKANPDHPPSTSKVLPQTATLPKPSLSTASSATSIASRSQLRTPPRTPPIRQEPAQGFNAAQNRFAAVAAAQQRAAAGFNPDHWATLRLRLPEAVSAAQQYESAYHV